MAPNAEGLSILAHLMRVLFHRLIYEEAVFDLVDEAPTRCSPSFSTSVAPLKISPRLSSPPRPTSREAANSCKTPSSVSPPPITSPRASIA